MKKFSRSMLGVTLLEIMLVLAIAAMVIVMSVRYYQSATASSQANSVMTQIQAIASAEDRLAQPTGSYQTAGATANVLAALGGGNSLVTVWGSSISIAPQSATVYNVVIPNMPAAVCNLVAAQLAANPHFVAGSISACGTSAASFSYNYTSSV